MVGVTHHLRPARHKHARNFPFDALGAAALVWCAVFLGLAFALGAWLR